VRPPIRAWKHHDGARALEHEAGSGAGKAERLRARGQRRLLAHTRLEVGIRPPQALGDPPRDVLDLFLQRRVEDELPACDPRDELDRAIVVRRAEPARDEAEVRLQPFAERRFQLGGVVADDRDPRRLDAQPQQLRGQERAVPVRAVAADELAAGGDDEPARARQAAGEIPCRVTRYVPPRVRLTSLPFRAIERLPGFPKLIQSRLATNRWAWPSSSVPV